MNPGMNIELPKDRLINFLVSQQVPLRLLEHKPCRSADESTAARASVGDPDSVGAKALLVKSRLAGFCMLALPAPARLASKRLRRIIGEFRFANESELAEITDGLEYGMVPPFGRPVFVGIERLYVDQALLHAETVGFNAASLTTSIVMARVAYIAVASPMDVVTLSEAG